MSLSNEEVGARIKELNSQIIDSINTTEQYLLSEEEPDMRNAVFNFSRVENLYLELNMLLKNKGIL